MSGNTKEGLREELMSIAYLRQSAVLAAKYIARRLGKAKGWYNETWR
jgi:hypothetical protein